MKKHRMLVCLLAVMLCMTAFSFPALAESSEWDDEEYEVYYDLNEEDEPVEYEDEEPVENTEAEPQIDPPVQETEEEAALEEAADPEPEPEPEETTGGMDEDDLDDLLGGLLTSFTPEGNLSLIDDFTFTGQDANGKTIQKQFITVQSKNGNYFYIIIDRIGENQNVYFLNMVDEADLMALLETGEEPEPEVCTCKDKCGVGHIDTTCPVCAKDMTRCIGEEPEPEPEPEPEEPTEEPQTRNKKGMLLSVILILALAGGAAYYFLKVKGGKSTPKTRGDTDLDDYDYGAEDDEYAEFEPYEDDGAEDSD